MHLGEGYFELRVGPYRLGLPAQSVLSVLEGPDGMDTPVVFRDRPIRCVDMRTLLVTAASSPSALGADPPALLVILELGVPGARAWVGLGVDAVGTVPITHTAPLAHIPTFGLRHPELFSGALRWDGRLVLALDLEGLARVSQFVSPVS